MRALATAAVVGATLAGVGAGIWYAREPDAPARPAAVNDELEGPVVEIFALIESADRASSASRTTRLHDARDRIAAASANHADDTRLHFLRGLVEVLAHRETETQTAYGRLVALSSAGERDPRALLLRSLQVLEFDADRSTEAVRLLRTLRAQAPNYMTGAVNRALFRGLVNVHFVQLDRDQGDDAVNSIEEAISVARDDPELSLEGRRARAYALGAANRWPECEAAWRELVAEGGVGLVSTRYQLAGALAAQNKVADADAEYTAVLDLVAGGTVPAHAVRNAREARLRRGNCRRLLGRYDEALSDVEAYLAAHPEDYRAEYWLGVVLIDGFEKPAAAEPHLRKAHAAAPWCDTYIARLLNVYETLMPDPAKAAPLRVVYDTQKKQRAEERARLVKSGRLEGFVCD